MWFGEPRPFPERGSPTRLSTSWQQSYEGWPGRVFIQLLEHNRMGTIKLGTVKFGTIKLSTIK